MKRRTRRGDLTIFVAGGVVCVVAFVLEPSDGRSSIDAAAMLLSYVGICIAVRQGVQEIQTHRADDDAPGWWSRFVAALLGRPRSTVAGLVTVLAAATFLTWYYTSASSIPITGDITVTAVSDEPTDDSPGAGLTDCYVDGERRTEEGSGDPAADCAQLRISLPGDPPARGHVMFLPVLHNPAATGSCVAPAEIVLTPVVDNVPREAVKGPSGEPVDIPIGGGTSAVHVLAEVDQRHDDLECQVSLTVTRAVLHD
ncbi:hypothetical protein [Promicromonospora soli]